MANGTCENGDDWMEWGSIFSLMLNGTLRIPGETLEVLDAYKPTTS